MAQLKQPMYPENCVAHDEIQQQLVAGLLAPHAYTASKYLYDALGSHLFAAICELPEYYPTRTEAAIFEQYGDQIAHAVGHQSTLIDLGAGNCAKAAKLFPVLRPRQYVPIDISVKFLQEAVIGLQRQFPQIEMIPLGMDFSVGLELPASVGCERRQFFYPGSSIGNFTQLESLVLLRRMHKAAVAGEGGGLLIGIDLIKDKAILDAAYDDALGVTAAFNLNLLNHLNYLLNADFDLADWCHRGLYDHERRRVEVHLEARNDTIVHWQNGGIRHFLQGERIHTGSSYKYTRQDFIDLLQQAGYDQVQTWCDPQEWFMVCHARAR